MGSCCCLAFLEKAKNHQLERDHFQRIVKFLEQVPLFKKQLPAAELPIVAQHLVEKRWSPGDVILRQGEMGERFFLIQAGELRALTTDEDGVQTERCRLRAGDYWGGHTLTTQRPNVATFIAGGKRMLVTLSMSKKDFEELGLKAKLVFPKRPALYRHPRGPKREKSHPDLLQATRTQDEQKFILDCIHSNHNLRALLSQTDQEMTAAMAANAERREIPEGTIVAECGEFGEGFFVIASGSFDVLTNTDDCAGKVRSAEVAVANSTMAERLRRKQHFLQRLNRRVSTAVLESKGAQSVLVSRHQSEKNHREDDGTRTENSFLHRWTPPSPTTRRRQRHSLGQSVDDLKRKLRSSESVIEHVNVGDRVVYVVPGEFDGMVGTVKGISEGLADVMFGEDIRRLDAELLRPILEGDAIARLQRGDSFGELSLIYNVSTEATFKTCEDSVVYLIQRKTFKQGVYRIIPRLEEYASLLDEVFILSPLVQAERWELARQAYGLVEFKRNERVLTQGEFREATIWYVIHRGYGFSYTKEDSTQKVRLGRARHFGERSILRGGPFSDVTVDAGPEGMVCLTFEGELIKRLVTNDLTVGSDDDGPLSPASRYFQQDIDQSVLTWLKEKGMHKDQQHLDVKLEDLRKVHLLGSGGFSDVFLAWDTKRDRHYALKRMSMGFIQSQGREATTIVVWERDLMLKVDSLFIIKLYTTFKDSEYVYFMSEALLGGDLLQVLHDTPEIFSEDEPRGSSGAFYVACLIAALEHLHRRCIVHRDVKPENVLIAESGYAKICDMGFARYVLGKTNTICGTPEYMPPEQIDIPHAHSHSADWWSLGVLTFELLSGHTPFDDEGIIDKRDRLLAIRRSQEKLNIHFQYGFPAGAKGFVLNLLKKLPHRLGAEGGAAELREADWFRRLDFDFDALHRQALQPPFVPSRPKELDLREEMRHRRRDSIFEPYQDSKSKHKDSDWTKFL